MSENTPSRKSITSHFLTLGIVFALLISGYSLFKVMTLQPGRKTTIVPGVTVEKPEKSVRDTYVSEKNELIVVYSDGSTRNLGSYKGRDGAGGASATISDVDVNQAVKTYCSSGRCDAKKPTPEVVLASVLDACGGNCKGKDAPAVTSEQIYAQVLAYCSNGKCKGETGATGATGLNGTNGADGRTQQLACIITTENNNTVRYYSAKYTDEPDSAYLTWAYRTKLPNWFQPNDCIDMRSV